MEKKLPTQTPEIKVFTKVQPELSKWFTEGNIGQITFEVHTGQDGGINDIKVKTSKSLKKVKDNEPGKNGKQ